MAAILKMAAMSAKGPIRDGSISKSVHNILVYLCAKFGAFMKKCTIGLISCSAIKSVGMNLDFYLNLFVNTEFEKIAV